MNIDRFLELLAIAAWIAFGVFVTVRFVTLARRRGLKVAAASLAVRQIILPLFLVAVITFVSAAIYFVQPQNMAIVVSALAPRGIRALPVEAGLRWAFPLLEDPVIYPIYWQTYTMSKNPMEGEEIGDDSITARTSDGQEVFLDCSVIYRLDPEQLVRIHIDWQERYTHDFVRPLVRGIVRTEVSQFTVSEVNSSKRLDLETELDRVLRETFVDKGLILDTFVLRNIGFSPEYAKSVEQKQVALEGKTQTGYQAEQIRNLARGEADKIRIEAEAEATAIMFRAGAEAEARKVKGQAEARALEYVTGVLSQNPSLITYEYVMRLSPSIRTMLLPSDAPLLLPMPTMAAEGTPGSDLLPVPIEITEGLTSTEGLTLTAPIETETPVPEPTETPTP